jgi:hypothetical protein
MSESGWLYGVGLLNLRVLVLFEGGKVIRETYVRGVKNINRGVIVEKSMWGEEWGESVWCISR